MLVTEEAPFAARDGAGGLVFQDRMWLLGGWNPDDKINFPKDCNSEVWSSNDGKNWRLDSIQSPWECRHTAGYAVHQNKMWIVGGDSNQGHYQNDVWNSSNGINWNLVCGQVPWGPRVLHYTVEFHGMIWIMGGQTIPQYASADEIFYRDVWNSEDGKNWKKITDNLPWAPRGMIGGSVVFNDRMWVIGGGTRETPQHPNRIFYNDVWSSANGIDWIQHTAAAPWLPRQYHEVAVFDNRMWVMEGSVQGVGNGSDVWYSGDGVEWTEVTDTPWLPRHAGSVFVYKSGLWMAAGNNMTSDVWKLTRILPTSYECGDGL